MLPREFERRQSVRLQAVRLADTGDFNRWQEIEYELTLDRRPYVAAVLADPLLRILLNLRCVLAARSHGSPVNAAFIPNVVGALRHQSPH